MILATLTAEENRLMTIVDHQAGSMEVKYHALDQCGIFTAYASIHHAYNEPFSLCKRSQQKLAAAQQRHAADELDPGEFGPRAYPLTADGWVDVVIGLLLPC